MFKRNLLSRELYTYKIQIMMLFKELLDRNNMFYGFIQCLPDDIYFSEYGNSHITKDYEIKTVKYNITQHLCRKAIDVSQ